ncbi:MAG: ATP phosphoribosyltransferase regulatory subunit [Thiomonas sp.]|uniref:ATP phosphoribosyltransferase regulatory subunit n=1 Tax=Thiomonas sp. TaxID=2047785 RepID=UPI002A35F830|nr:ATP phosphoribosyltransferase regulatory subunit [Thiomonas sp.]MDY0329034.1 ATP phosphoribosyltransferase regulatory subunit [Thiomonas sp.]
MSNWRLPEYFSDVLPREAAVIEHLRRACLDAAQRYGYALVMPPLLEFVDSLLSGTGQDLDLQTFKLVDQISGRALGLRADMTPQAARIDAHLLNQDGVTRVCYCGSAVRTHPEGVHASREILQFGAELYGHAGLEADLEVQQLSLDCLRLAGVEQAALDLADNRIVRGALAGLLLGPQDMEAILDALASKDAGELRLLTRGCAPAQRAAILALPELYGDAQVLQEARRILPQHALILQALDDLAALARHHQQRGARVQIDLADMRGYRYHSGVIFSVYAQGYANAVARGGRYDEVGASFGRPRAATGFSMDLREVARFSAAPQTRAVIVAEWSTAPGLSEAVADLRLRGETVVQLPLAQAREAGAFRRQLVQRAGAWQVEDCG